MSAMIHTTLKASLLLLTSSFIFLSPTYARNAFFPQGLGSQFTTAGAGTALPIEPTNVDSNPAVLTRMDTQISAYLANYFQRQSLDSSGAFVAPGVRAGNAIGKQNNRFANAPGGTLGVNYVLNHKWSVGLGTSGGSSMVKYRASILNPANLQPPFSTFHNEFVNTIMLFNPTVSYAPNPCASYGASLIFGYQTVKTNLSVPALLPPFSQTSGAFRKDTANGIGIRIGGLWDLTRFLSVGASASTPVKFSKFKKYRDVFAHSFDVPAIYRLGLAFHAGATDYLFDIKQIMFGQVKSLGNDLGWRNSTVLMMGLQHKLMNCLYLTAGYNYGRSPVAKNNILLNGLIVPIARHHFTLGARYRLLKHWDLSIGGEYSPTSRMVDDGTGLLGQKAGGTIMRTRELGAILGIAYHF